MKGFVGDIEELTEENADYRHVLYTGKHLQLVLMSLAPGEEIGEEVHEKGGQFFRVEKGNGEVLIESEPKSRATTPLSFQPAPVTTSSTTARNR